MKSIYPSVDEMTNLKTRDRKRKSKTLKSDSEKIKNAIRIIDFRIEKCLENKREMERQKFLPEVMEMGNSLMDKMIKNLQEIRDELIPEEKST